VQFFVIQCRVLMSYVGTLLGRISNSMVRRSRSI